MAREQGERVSLDNACPEFQACLPLLFFALPKNSIQPFIQPLFSPVATLELEVGGSPTALGRVAAVCASGGQGS